jgi:hypothetical protein
MPVEHMYIGPVVKGGSRMRELVFAPDDQFARFFCPE